MPAISDIEVAVLDQLEDNRVAPVFWDLPNEIRPLIVEAMCEATLISGEPEVRQPVTYDLAANTTIFPMPAATLAISRMESPGGLPIRKTSVFDLDMENTSWQSEVASANNNVIRHWFPLGLKSFGIHPQLAADVQVIITGVGFPSTFNLPFTGVENVPFQSEFNDALERYACHAARLKEGGPEFDASMVMYEEFLGMMEELSKFGLRKGSLRFSKVVGSAAIFNEVEKK